MTSTRRVVAVMAKRPEPGRTKTRLTPPLTPAQAAEFFAQMLFDTLDRLQARTDTDLVIATDHPDSADWFRSIAPAVAQVSQGEGPLGDRLATVLGRCLDNGFGQVFALGSDSPDLPSGHLDDAFAALGADDVDIVLGPADDGGYYLIGQKQPWPRVVTEVEMSTPTVLSDTLRVAAADGARVHLAPPWYDVDISQDLVRLRTDGSGVAVRSVAWLDEFETR